MVDRNALIQAFSLLGRILDHENTPALELYVCGGSSLLWQNLSKRVTKDVDVVALVNHEDEKDMLLAELPDFLTEAAAQVSLDLELPSDWLNTGPSDIMQVGLPEGFQDRTVSEKFGDRLTLHFLGRYDLIHLKLYAAADRGPGDKHVSDLLLLDPDESELLDAARWAMTHDPSDGFALIMKTMLSKLGFQNAAEKL